jgi:uncharacterized cupredoxin-like copper-binding protein
VLRRLFVLFAIVAASLLLVACNGDDAQDATTRIEVLGTNGLAFQPDSFTVPAGQEVTVELTSEDQVEHDFVIEDANGDIDVVHADAGETATGTFTIDAAGTYEFFCAVPGHRAAGMDGTLTVVDN